MHWYQLHNEHNVDSPALLVYPGRMRNNIRRVKGMINDVQRLRPHVKTSKMREAVQLMLEEGIYRFKCATIAEAEMLGMAAAPDALLAYQPVGPKIARLLQLVKTYPGTRFSCLTDNIGAAADIAAVFNEAGMAMPVYVDLNVGMNRTGIAPGPAALELYRQLQELPGVTAAGLHVYDGHLHDTDMTLRARRCNEAFAPVEELAAAITREGMQAPVIVAGGSPTYPIHAQRRDVECSPGTFIFWDWGYQQHLPEQDLEHAALLLTRVISVIDRELLCLDLGHKSVAAENPQPRVLLLNMPGAQPVSQSEEHLVVRVPDTTPYPVGTACYGVPYHICPTVALYERATVVENNAAVAEWRVIARDRKIDL